MAAGRRSWFLAAMVLLGAMLPLASSNDLDPVKQRDDQKKIKARVDEAARRAQSTLNAMRYQRLPVTAEQKTIRDVADGLRGLSETEIKAVLDHLEKAVSAPDPKTATKEQKDAYEK